MSDLELFPNATGVLRPTTLKTLAKNFSRATCAIVDGWAAQNPKTLKAMEKSGQLVAKVKQTEDEQTRAQQRAVERIRLTKHAQTWHQMRWDWMANGLPLNHSLPLREQHYKPSRLLRSFTAC